MAKWISCGSGFIEADVIRWKEGVWQKRGRSKKSRAIHIGERMVIAEVLREVEEGWVRLLIRGGAVLDEKPGRKPEALPKGTEVRRKRSTIERGKPERLLWSDESARATLASKFLGKGEV